jgi:hypothetical protein
MLKTEITITNRGCSGQHIIGHGFDVKVPGNATTTISVNANLATAALSKINGVSGLITASAGATADDGITSSPVKPIPYAEIGAKGGVASLDAGQLVEQEPKTLDAERLLSTALKTLTDIESVMTFAIATEELAVGTGGTAVSSLDIPKGALMLSVQLINKTDIADDDGNDTYTAAFSGGSTEDINGWSAIAKDQNAKASEALNIITTDVTNITLTPNGTNFASGEVRLDVLYGTVKDLEDYPVEEGGE